MDPEGLQWVNGQLFSIQILHTVAAHADIVR